VSTIENAPTPTTIDNVLAGFSDEVQAIPRAARAVV
jgi:hypothetical protein